MSLPPTCKVTVSTAVVLGCSSVNALAFSLRNLGPETVDHSLIGTTRRVNPNTGMIEWTRMPSNGGRNNQSQNGKESIIYRLDPVREAGRLVFQLGTSDPDRAVAAARAVAGDVAGIDVNAGCPKPFSTSGGMGAALLRTPDLLCAILRALVAAVVPEHGVGVSVKIRLLEDPAETETLVRRLVATGVAGLTVHCRTPDMRPRERAIRGQLPMVAALCREAGVACLMNGDVENRDQAVPLVEEFGVDGAMIALAAERNFSCFRSAADGGLAPWREVAEKYLGFALEVENKWNNTKFMLNQIIPGKEPVYRALVQAKCYAETCDILDLPSLAEQARDVDDRLELQPSTAPKKGGKASGTALAAGRQMAKARTSGSQPRKSMSKRGVTASQPPPTATAPISSATPSVPITLNS